jgi:hypothetical protein
MIDRKRSGNFIHGLSFTPTHIAWINMRQRCQNPNRPDYKHYGGRGISVYERWNNFNLFLKDMGLKPKGLTLERIDNDKGYYKSNCKWATIKEQRNNNRRNHLITFGGKTFPMVKWAELTGLPYDTIRCRLKKKNWTIKESLTLPICIGGVKLSLLTNV